MWNSQCTCTFGLAKYKCPQQQKSLLEETVAAVVKPCQTTTDFVGKQ